MSVRTTCYGSGDLPHPHDTEVDGRGMRIIYAGDQDQHYYSFRCPDHGIMLERASEAIVDKLLQSNIEALMIEAEKERMFEGLPPEALISKLTPSEIDDFVIDLYHLDSTSILAHAENWN